MIRFVSALLVLLLAASAALADVVDLTDKAAPEPSCTEWHGGPAVKLAKLRPSVVVLHVSDPGRSTSKGAHVYIKRLFDEYGGGDLRVVEVIVGTSSFGAASHAEKNGATWFVGVDGDRKTEQVYAGTSLPRTYLIGPDGKVMWNGHPAGITKEMVEAQLARVVYFDSKRVPRKGKALAKAAGKLDFGKALSLAEKAEKDPYVDDETKALAVAVRTEAERHFEFQWKLHEAELERGDRATAWFRLERLAKSYKRTAWQPRVDKAVAEAKAHPRTAYCVKVRKLLDGILKNAGSTKKKDVESMINALKLLSLDYEGTVEAESAVKWVRELERRVRDGEVK